MVYPISIKRGYMEKIGLVLEGAGIRERILQVP